MSAKLLSSSLIALFIAIGCGTTRPAATPAATATPPPTAAGAVAASSPRDARIVALASAAAKCELDDGSFDVRCEAYQAWLENQALFEEGKGDATLLTLLEDADVKLRNLAVYRGFAKPERLFAAKPNAARLLAVLRNETDKYVARQLAADVAELDLEELGLDAELKVVAGHAVAVVRDNLGLHLYARKQTPLRLEVTKTLLADTDSNVRLSALSGLSTGARLAKAPAACNLMGEQLAREPLALWTALALSIAAYSGCLDFSDKLAAELVTRSGNADVAAKDGVLLRSAIQGLCEYGNDAHKKKGFAAAKSLTDAKVKDSNVRERAMEAAVACDRAASRALLTTLSMDAEKSVAESAKKELSKLDLKK
jgi:hypothetical protein